MIEGSVLKIEGKVVIRKELDRKAKEQITYS